MSGRLGSHRVVLFVQSAGPVEVDTTLAAAILLQGYGGEETGHGFADVLLGRTAPSARLPVTVYREKYLDMVGPVSDFNMVSNGTGRTYRFLPPDSPLMQFTFGFGLSYASFHYSNLTVSHALAGSLGVTVSVNVARIESSQRPFQGVVSEVVQVYVRSPQIAPEAAGLQYGLKGVRTVKLAAGQSRVVSIDLPAASFESTSSNGTRSTVPGSHTIFVSGHAPKDPRGLQASNVVQVELQLP